MIEQLYNIICHLMSAASLRRFVVCTFHKIIRHIAVAAAEHTATRLNSPPECKHEDVQAAHFKPRQTRRCIYKAGRRWYNAKKTRQIMRWKHYNFLENIEMNSDSSDDERQLRHDPSTDKREQYKRTQRQLNLNAWLKAEGSQKFKRRRKK